MSLQSDVQTSTTPSQESQPTEEVLPPSPDQLIHEDHFLTGLPQGSPSEACNSDSGFSISSNSSGDITGTPFDSIGSQRYEYPFPPDQGASSEPFLPLSSSSPPNCNSPSWPLQLTNSFPLTAPPTRRFRTHPKLLSATTREPPVPPSLVNKRSFWTLGLQRQPSAESQQSDISDPAPRGLKSFPYGMSLNEQDTQPTSDSEITVCPCRPLAPSTSASRSRKGVFKGVASQKTLISGGDHVSDVSAVDASVSNPGQNGAHKQLDLRPGGAPERVNVYVSSIGKVLRMVTGRLLNWVLRFFLGS